MLFRKVFCYVGVPEELKDKKPISVEGAEISKLPTLKFVSLDTLCRRLGAKL